MISTTRELTAALWVWTY